MQNNQSLKRKMQVIITQFSGGHFSEMGGHFSEKKWTFQRQKSGHFSEIFIGHFNEFEKTRWTFQRQIFFDNASSVCHALQCYPLPAKGVWKQDIEQDNFIIFIQNEDHFKMKHCFNSSIEIKSRYQIKHMHLHNTCQTITTLTIFIKIKHQFNRN